ncbi:autotransporter-associated beta strand repeat-containing protein, partial [Desulfovibrio sp. OttesenSCG-928-G15]|nr:autotransporter-associated beta strand repeat-containing protein [Desulfovibrio sp. OttesenSCG-928-G15]
WYLGDSRAHGTFTIAEGESFTLSAALTDEAGNVNWNGQTLTKKGGGTLVLTGANTYTGKTTISAGTLTLSGAGTLGNGNYAGAIENNGALVLDQTSAQTLSGVVSGAGNINKSGNGVLTLSGNSSGYTGTFTQAAGTVHVTNNLGGTFIQNAGTLTSTSGTTLGAATFKGTVTPTGTLNVASASFDGATVNLGNGGVNTVTATGAISFISNVTTISIGDLSGSGTAVLTLVSSTGGAISGLDMVDAQATLGDRRGGLYLADGDTKLFFGIITGSTALTWAGSSSAHNWNTTDNNTNWTTGNFNTYFKTGDDVTFADDGAYRKVTVADSGVTVGAMNVNGDYNFSGGTITAGAVSVADDKTLGLTAGSTPALSAATVTFNTSGKLNITGYTPDESSPYNSASKNTLTVISTSGGVSGFAPANVTVAGQTSVDFLTARAYRDGNDIKVDTTLSWFLNDSTAHGTFTIAEGESFTLSAALADEAGNVNWNGQTLTKKGGGTLVLTGANTYSGGTTVSEGLINFNSPGNFSTGNVTLDGGGLQWASGNTADISDRLNAIGTGGATFDTNGQDVIFATGLSGGGVIKDGAGTLTLAGTNSYTGMTTVRSGTLALGAGGSLASTDLTLHAGTVFDATAGTHSLDNGSLTVWGEGATYQGNLSARGATLNFIASGPVAGSMLGVTGTADVDGSNVNVGVFGGHTFATGDTLSLLKAAGGLTGTVTQGDGSGILKVGATVVHNLSLTATTDEITATVTAGSATEQAKALSEGYLGGVILALQGADLIAGRGMDSARQAAGTASRTGGGYGMAGFGAVSGGMLRYNTGSHVDMHSISLLTGLSWGANTRAGDLTVSAFFEFGNGSYDTHNSFAGAASVDGDGSTHYLGGGVLGRMDFTDTGPGHIYAEVSARAGKVHNDYDSSDLRDANGRTADYESSAPYYGLHLGAGYVWNINEKASLDVYGKYFWTRQEGDSTSLSTGESLRFKDVDSHRLRTGARFAYEVNEYISPYIGAAWEHEFDGKAKATTNGNRIDAPDMKGSTGIGELGLTVKPSQNLPLTFDLGVQGYTGKREGVTGSLQFRWEF